MINEIELESGRISLQCFDLSGNMKDAVDNADKFDLLEESANGFHDYDSNDEVFRGYYSFIQPFEVECLVEGMTTKELKKRIKTCEFIANDNFLFAWGNNAAIKLMISMLNNGFATTNKIEFEFDDMYNFQARLDTVKSISIKNPKESEARTVKLSGKLDCYNEYNVVAETHEIKSVSGEMKNTPIGKIKLAVTDKGVVRINSGKGLIVSLDAIMWVLRLIQASENNT